MPSPESIFSALKRYWGYDSFRPMQERIVHSLLSGHDTCVVMPTGGGKSLCYQLPAAMLPDKTVVVISPLIALMQDQMAQLSQMGIPAATINSAIAGEQQARVVRAAQRGEYRLLYLSPERLARKDTIEWLQRVPLAFFAIDEAHCISEWGHEFRPDYRQLSALRRHFPHCAIAAFTASATRQVRHDILHQLELRNPDKYIASFHRPNLKYIVQQCDSEEQDDLLVRAIGRCNEGNIIVYSPTIKRVGTTVALLEARGIPAIGYHAQMPPEIRKVNQERWMQEEVRVLVGTIAFGLGINKGNVRAVIHLSLPKSIEQYYQEAGRAGRDGDPADCLLLWQKQDVSLLRYFIEQIEDPAEKQRAWTRYHQVVDFAEERKCRHLQICRHFGETPKWETCGACDVCGAAPPWLAKASVASDSDARRKSKGKSSSSGAAPLSAADRELNDYLREWRRDAAKEQGVAAFVVMHDSTLDEVCRMRPASIQDLRRIPGIGVRKTELYGDPLLQAIRRFSQGSRASGASKKSSQQAEETRALLAKGHSLSEIAHIRGRQLGTVVALVADMLERDEIEFQSNWMPAETVREIERACEQLGTERLRPIKDAVAAEITFDEIRLVVAKVRAEKIL